MDTVKVSVVIPVYNVEPYLRDCLDSLAAQTLHDIEIICIDDGSTDSSLEILREYEVRDVRFRIFTQVNAGAAAARNRGIGLAIGEFLYFCDADDYVLQDTLNVLYNKACAEKLDILCFSGESFYENKTLESEHAGFKGHYVREFIPCCSGPELLDLFHHKQKFRASLPLQFYNTVFLKSQKLLLPEGIMCEDEFFTPLALLKAERAACIENVFYMRRVRANSIMTSAVKHQKFDSQFTVYSMLIAEYIHGNYQEKPGGYGLFASAQSMYYGSIKTFDQLPPQERDLVLNNASPAVSFLFMDHQKAEDLRSSASFKAGRAITWLPRKLRNLVR